MDLGALLLALVCRWSMFDVSVWLMKCQFRTIVTKREQVSGLLIITSGNNQPSTTHT